MDAPFPSEMMPCIERFFRYVHPTLKPGRDIYEEVFHTDLFFPLQRKAELVEMMKTVRSISPKTIVEIGADKGGGLYHFCHGLPSVERAGGIEIRGTPYAPVFERNFPDITFYWGEDSSRSTRTLEGVGRWLKGEKIDVLFIDGDKEGFLHDFDTYLSVMNPKGIVLMHDIVDGGPGRSFEAIKQRGYQTRMIHDISDYKESEARGGSPTCPYDGWLRHWKGRSCGVGVIYLESKGAPSGE